MKAKILPSISCLYIASHLIASVLLYEKKINKTLLGIKIPVIGISLSILAIEYEEDGEYGDDDVDDDVEDAKL